MLAAAAGLGGNREPGGPYRSGLNQAPNRGQDRAHVRGDRLPAVPERRMAGLTPLTRRHRCVGGRGKTRKHEHRRQEERHG
jgi:hypothetical protein